MKSVPVLTFFNNKGGVGKTSLVFHLAWMLSRLGHRVLTCDLDPQANLTAAFLEESALATLWNSQDHAGGCGRTVFQCVRPLMDVQDLRPPAMTKITPNMYLVPGDLSLAGFEDTLSDEWPKALGSTGLYRPIRIQTAFYHTMQQGAANMNASVILADVGPNLGAINRSALVATDHVVVPLGADLFSLQGLRNLGPALNRWRKDWQRRVENWCEHEQDQTPANGLALPGGNMRPAGYVVQQHGVRLGRPVRAYDRWVNRMPEEYGRSLAGQTAQTPPATPDDDEHCLATMKHYRSLVPMAQEVRKPIFDLTPADGAFGSHAIAARDAEVSFRELALKICKVAHLVPSASLSW